MATAGNDKAVMMQTGPTTTLGAAILAGGRARRYGGADKSALDCGDGRKILQKLLDELAGADLGDAIVCANDPGPFEGLHLPVVADLRPDCGPLGGIAAALTHFRGRTDGTVLLACDLPGISAVEIRALVQAFRSGRDRVVVAATGDSLWHPLCSVVHNDVLPEVLAAVEAEEFAVGRLWRRLRAGEVRFDDETPFFNINTPEDLATWRERYGLW